MGSAVGRESRPELRRGRLDALMETDAPASVLLIRLAVGGVFVSEGIQKFLFAGTLGAGRFAKIGIPAPDILGPFVGTFEVVCGVLVLAGLLTRLAALPLLAIMVVAIVATKLPILLGHGFWSIPDPSAASTGLWSMLHEARTDFSMLLGSMFLSIVGAGRFSVDAQVARRLSRTRGDRGST